MAPTGSQTTHLAPTAAHTAHLAPHAHPAHALLSVAHALLSPANTLSNPVTEKDPVLPIEDTILPDDDSISDLSDVVDAINKLCDTMKTSTYEPEEERDEPAEPPPVPVRTIRYDHFESTQPMSSVEVDTQPTLSSGEVDLTETEIRPVEYRDIELVSPEEIVVQKVEVVNTERWSDSTSVSLPPMEDIETVTSDTDPANNQCEPISEMYYTASSEVSLLSDTEVVEKVQNDEDGEKDDRKNVIAGHVAAMRERFESMTRTNTPCPDLVRSLSPSLEVFRNTSPSPDRLA